MFQLSSYFKTPRRKLIIAFFITLILSLVTWLINRNAFDEINQVIKTVTSPNPRLDSLRSIQAEVSKFVYLDRLEVMNDASEPSENFKNKQAKLKLQITSLRDNFLTDSLQFNRFKQIDSILETRYLVFEKYLKMRYRYNTSGVFDEQFLLLAQEVESENLKIDSNVVTTEKTTTKYTVYPPETETKVKRGLFRKKKKIEEVPQPTVYIEEERKVNIDTVSVSEKKDSILLNIKSSLNSIEQKRSQGRLFLQEQEVILIQTNTLLLNQFFDILKAVEADENRIKSEQAQNSIRISEQTLSLTRKLSAVFIFSALFLILIIFWDISRMNTYRRELEKAKNEAEFHSQAKQRFLSNMSHEIRTPLQAILGFSELLKQQQKPVSTPVHSISNAASHLLQVVNEILDYSKIISGKYTLEPVDFELSEVIQQMDETFAILCEQKRLNWNFIPPTQVDLSVFRADSFRIKQVLYNLLSNALKFTEFGSIQFEVEFNPEKKELIFQIIDTGKGIDKRDIDRVFKQYEQAKGSDQQLGTGLGLTIVRELIELMQGSVNMKSELGLGTAFTVTIPVEVVERNSKLIDKIKKSAIPLLDEIWVVDDDALILSLYASIFTKQGIQFKSFSSAEALLEHEIPPSVKQLYIDLRLPGISGSELCSKLRNEFHLNLKMVAVTAQVLPQEKETVLSAGFDAIILKPFTQAELLDELYTPKVLSFSDEFELSTVAEMLGDASELEYIVDDFIRESKEDIHSILHLLETEKTEKLPELILLVHRLAGRLAQFGSRNLSLKMRHFEHDMKENQIVNQYTLKSSLAELETIFNKR